MKCIQHFFKVKRGITSSKYEQNNIWLYHSEHLIVRFARVNNGELV